MADPDQSPRRALAIIAASTVAGGAFTGLIWPRGPLTTLAALALFVVAVAAGLFAGWRSGNRWPIVLMPVCFLAGYEMTGGGVGPTAGAIDVTTSWGIVGAIAGRALLVCVALLPMAVGAALGAGQARATLRKGSAPAPDGWLSTAARDLRRAPAAVGVLLLIVLAWQLVRPASVPAITPKPGKEAVAELLRVSVRGGEVWVNLRGRDRTAPVLLYLPGGPGQSDLGLGRALLEPLTEDFVVAILDPRGVGKSYAQFSEDLTTDQAVEDVLEVTRLLRERSGGQRVFLFGESGGSVLGVLAVQRAPERFAAWIGSGQMVAPRLTDVRIRKDLAAYLRKHGETAALDTLQSFGDPPYASVGAYAWISSYYDALAGDYDPPASYLQRGEQARVGPLGLLAPEYRFVDRFGAARGLMDTFAVLYPQWQRIDFRGDVPELKVPVHIFTGAHELTGRRVFADQWFETLRAPRKQLHDFENAGHAAAFEHVEALHAALKAELRRSRAGG